MIMMLEIIMMLKRAVLIMMVFRMRMGKGVWPLTVVNNSTSCDDDDFGLSVSGAIMDKAMGALRLLFRASVPHHS